MYTPPICRILNIAALIAVAACSRDPVSSSSTGDADLIIRANVSGTNIASLVIEVTAADLDVPLVFNIPVADGVGTGTITVPAGSDRLISAHAFDAKGIETHQGSTTVDVVAGDNATVAIELLPLNGQIPVEVTVGSTVVIIEPGAAVVPVGGSVQLVATVYDADGNVRGWPVTWASGNPSIASVDDNGLVTGHLLGDVQIFATAGDARGVADIFIPDVVQYTLGFYRDIDLDAGIIFTCDAFSQTCDSSADFRFAFNAGRDVHAVVFQRQNLGREIAHLRGRAFDDVTADDVATADFTASLIDEPFDDTRVVLIRTDTGSVFKMGAISENDEGVTFLVARLTAG